VVLNHIRAEQRRTHPARVEPFSVQGQQEVLGGGPEALDRHELLCPLSIAIRIVVRVAQIET
jgi:hypothetical protein